MNYLMVLIVSFCTLAADDSTDLALWSQDGAFQAVYIDQKVTMNKKPGDYYLASFKKYTKSGLTSKTEKIDRAAVSFPIVETSLKLGEKSRVLKKGVVVLDKDHNPKRVVAVFANGQVILEPLELNQNSKNRLKDHPILATVQRSNFDIVDKDSILAVTQECFQNYCVGQTQDVVMGETICPTDCKVSNKMISTVFSNGSMVVGSKLYHFTATSTPSDTDALQVEP